MLRKYYPNKFINKEDGKRYFIYNTLFNLPEIYAIASMIDMYEKLDEYVVIEKESVKNFPLDSVVPIRHGVLLCLILVDGHLIS